MSPRAASVATSRSRPVKRGELGLPTLRGRADSLALLGQAAGQLAALRGAAQESLAAIGVGGVERGLGGDEVHAEVGESTRRVPSSSRPEPGHEGVGVIDERRDQRAADPARQLVESVSLGAGFTEADEVVAKQRLVHEQSRLGRALGAAPERVDGRRPLSDGRQCPASPALDQTQFVQLHGVEGHGGEFGDGGTARAGIGAHAGGEGDSPERPAQRRHVVQLAIESSGFVEVAPSRDESTAVDGDQSVQQGERGLEVGVVGGDGGVVASACEDAGLASRPAPQSAYTGPMNCASGRNLIVVPSARCAS